ncbi:MAG: polysaccharide biosynthesis tyrosine autokinase [Pseudomonadota bacterium]
MQVPYKPEREMPQPSGQPGGQGLTLNLDEILRMLRRHMWMLIAFLVVALGISVFALTRMTPLYTSSAQFLLGEQGRAGSSINDLVTGVTLNDTIIEGEMAILQSGRLLGRVVEKLELHEDPEFNSRLRKPSVFEMWSGKIKSMIKSFLRPAPAPDPNQNDAISEAAKADAEILGKYGAVIGALRGSMNVRQQGNSFVIVVAMTSESPTKAAAIANTILDEYINFRLEAKFEAAQRESDWLNERLAGLEADVVESENEVLRERERATTDAQTTERLNQQISEATTRLVAARADLAESRARLQKIRRIADMQSLAAAADVMVSEVISGYRRDLADLRREEAASIRRFGAESPKVLPITQSIETLETEIEREVGRHLQELSNTVDISQSKVSALQAGVKELELLALEQSKQQVKISQLARIAAANRLIYEDFLNRFKESRDVQNLQQADAEVISYASPPNQPSSPRIKVTVLLAAFAGLFLGLGLMLLIEMRRIGFMTSEAVTEDTGLPVYTSFSQARLRGSVRQLIDGRYLKGKAAYLAEEARQLRTYLQVSFDMQVNKVVLITSSVQNEGKTTTALLLAWAAQQSGRSCLIIDGDLRKPSLSRDWKADDKPDLVSVLQGKADLKDAIRKDEATGCDLLPTTTMHDDPADLLANGAMDDMIIAARMNYDMVVIDSPPLLPVPDTMVFADQADLILMMVRWRRTPKSAVRRALGMLRSVTAQSIGGVMTLVDRKQERQYYDHGYHSYEGDYSVSTK